MKIIEGSEDKYKPGTPEYEAWLEGREHFMAFGDDPTALMPYTDEKLMRAFIDGIEDETIWQKDSTGN